MLLNTGRNRGVPNSIMISNNHAAQIDSRPLPSVENAIHNFEGSGGHLTIFNSFGEDPLQRSPLMVAQREREFLSKYPDFETFFHTVANGDYYLFREGILYFIDITRRLSNQLATMH